MSKYVLMLVVGLVSCGNESVDTVCSEIYSKCANRARAVARDDDEYKESLRTCEVSRLRCVGWE